MKKKLAQIIAIITITLTLSGCATPLGQHYGTIGGLGGAAIGGALGGLEGAAIGGAAGAITGGALGDQQQFELERERQNGGYNQYRRDNGYHRGGGYVRPCNPVNVPVYDSYGYEVGYRTICQ